MEYQSNIQNNQQRSSSNKSMILKIMLVFALFFGLLIMTSVGLLGWKLYDNTHGRNNSTSSQALNPTPTTRDFSTSTVSQPTGSVIELVNKTAPAVVTVIGRSESRGLFSDQLLETQEIGTGFFISEDGLLVTNEHVVCDARTSENLSIVTAKGKTYQVDAFASDSTQDIAILKVNTGGDKVSTLKFANPDTQVVVGEDVIAIGNPLGTNPGSVTRGIISGVNRNITAAGQCGNRNTRKDYEGILQTDAAINSGNSGGPLINLNGEVIGVNSATSEGANNISYSIPFQRVLKLIDRYQKNNGRLTSPYIGIQYRMVDANRAKQYNVPAGALVSLVVRSGPAEAAGIKPGDIITKLGDKSIEFSLQTTLSQYFEPNQEINVELYRPARVNALGQDFDTGGKLTTVKLKIGEITNNSTTTN